MVYAPITISRFNPYEYNRDPYHSAGGVPQGALPPVVPQLSPTRQNLPMEGTPQQYDF